VAPPPGEVRIALPDWVLPGVDWERTYASLDERARLATGLARENVERGTGGPFGAAVFERDTGRLVAVGVNGVVPGRNSVLHAEVLALMLAERRVGFHSLRAPGLPPHELVSSCEPCVMCFGATLWSGVARLVFAASRGDAEAFGFDEGPAGPEGLAELERRGVEVRSGILAGEGRAALELYRLKHGPIYNG
jgi:tRNA(Arg) A34 adenosine deaminase TadA